MSKSHVPALAAEAVLVPSVTVPEGAPTVSGYDFNRGVDYDALLASFAHTGFQATNFRKAVDEVNKMRTWRLSHEPIVDRDDPDFLTPESREAVRCTIFLGYTSNLVSSGVRDVIRFLVQHRMVDCLVTTAGGVEEDLIKCLAPTYLGEFSLKGAELRRQGLNRIGNLLVPNDNYCKFEDWVNPILDQLLLEQKRDGVVWSPSRIIERLGREINDERSIYYWAARNGIPVFSPALTDGSLGDMMYFHSYRNPGLICDIVSDIRRINDLALRARHTGCVVLGGGVIKHHIMNANLMRNGADHVVYINTAQEFDGSDSGAAPDEAVSWGKIRLGATPVKVYADASIVFPLLVAQTFARDFRPAADASAAAAHVPDHQTPA